MKKIVPFKKEINFNTNIAEVTSISLEHTLKVGDYLISGDFIVSGEYKIADISVNTEKFEYTLPFDIALDEKYILDKVVADIDDFYYEIVNDKVLLVNIDVSVDNLVEKPLIEKEKLEEETEKVIEAEILEDEIEEDREGDILTDERKLENIDDIMEMDIINPIKIEDNTVKVDADDIDIFNNFDGGDSFSTYRVCIIREGDTIESILEKYSIPREDLEKYNDLSDLKIGDKLIIPS